MRRGDSNQPPSQHLPAEIALPLPFSDASNREAIALEEPLSYRLFDTSPPSFAQAKAYFQATRWATKFIALIPPGRTLTSMRMSGMQAISYDASSSRNQRSKSSAGVSSR